MASTLCLLCFVAAVTTILPPVADSSPISLEDDQQNTRQFYRTPDKEDGSSEVGVQTFGGDQEGAEDSQSSEEVGVFGSSAGGGVGPDPPPVRPPVEPSQGPVTSDPNPGTTNPRGGGIETATQLATMPPLTAPTTPPRGDGGTGSFVSRPTWGRALNPDPLPNPAQPSPPPKIHNNIAAISQDVEVPVNLDKQRLPLGALLTVVVIGGLVVVMAGGGVAYLFATRVRIS